MIKEINIMPRASGKTTQLIERFLKDLDKGNECRYICFNLDMAKYVKRVIYNDYHMRLGEGLILSASNLKHEEEFFGINDLTIYVDDYFFLPNTVKKVLWTIVNSRRIGFISNTTSDILYKKELIELTKLIKSNESCYFCDLVKPEIMREIYGKYFCNLLTDPDCEVNSRNDDAYRRVPPEVFETAYMGRFLK